MVIVIANMRVIWDTAEAIVTIWRLSVTRDRVSQLQIASVMRKESYSTLLSTLVLRENNGRCADCTGCMSCQQEDRYDPFNDDDDDDGIYERMHDK